MEQADNIANKLSNFVTSVRKIISKTIIPGKVNCNSLNPL